MHDSESSQYPTMPRIGNVSPAEDTLDLVIQSVRDAETEAPLDGVDFPPGRPLSQLNRYIRLNLLARGGCGEVWDAFQDSLGRRIAIKRLRNEYTQRYIENSQPSREARRAFFREALLTGVLEHPNIVPIHDIGCDETGEVILVMRLIRGRPWTTLLREDKALPLPEFLDKHLPILIDMAQAVSYAHSRGVLHLDLKPAQVMVGEFGEVLLMDWGLARVYDRERFSPPDPQNPVWRDFPLEAGLAGAGGTPAYMAPEQTGSKGIDVGPPTDVFLIGATLYLILTGVPPHAASGEAVTIELVERCAIPHPRTVAPDREIPVELADLCMRALAENPAERFPTVASFLAELKDLITGARQRRESRKLVDQVIGMLAPNDLDYALLNDAEIALDRARELWPENAQLPPVRQRLFSIYARVALDNGDLVLARRLSMRLDDTAERGELLAEVDALTALGQLEQGELEVLERERRTAEVDLRSIRGELTGAQATVARQLDLVVRGLRSALDLAALVANQPASSALAQRAMHDVESLAAEVATQGDQAPCELLLAGWATTARWYLEQGDQPKAWSLATRGMAYARQLQIADQDGELAELARELDRLVRASGAE